MIFIFGITDSINDFLSWIFFIFAAIGVLFHILYYSTKVMKERGLLQGPILTTILILQYALGIGISLGLAWLLTKYTPITFATVIWVEMYAFVIYYFITREHAEVRGIYSALLHLVVLSAGWYMDRWLGILFFSVPLLFVFNHMLSRIALVIIPTSDPDNLIEMRQRRKVFFSYVFGLQMPFWNVSEMNARELEKRIDGAPFLDTTPFPGMLRTYSHQVVGVSNGINFRVEGPGVVFTKKGDQPFEVVDLRSQTRNSTIHAFSKEGIPFLANVSVTFKIDREPWHPILHHQLKRANPLMIGGKVPDRNLKGMFPYSSVRVRSALYLRSKQSQPDEMIERWDDHILSAAEEAAREILAERPLIELWNLENPNTNALDEIAKQMKIQIEFPLRVKGIFVVATKAVPDFSDKEGLADKEREVNKTVVKQQIDSWNAERERERIITQTEAEIIAEEIEQEARVYAHSALLTAIAEGLQMARTRDPNLMRYVIALRYVGALESMINQLPNDPNDPERQNTLSTVKGAKRNIMLQVPRD